MNRLDAIIISDIHLGSSVSQVKRLHQFLKLICEEEVKVGTLVINGDLFDSPNLGRLNKKHWKIVSDIRSISDHIHTVVNMGNHDRDLDILSIITGFQPTDEYVFTSGDQKMLAFHGDKYDTFITDHPIITGIADIIYSGLQKLDRSFFIARQAKRTSKTFLRCAEDIELGAINHAKKLGCSSVFCGHTHLETVKLGNINYYNSGCWTEEPCTYIAIKDGKVEVKHFEE